jgi:hypothetical protein
MENLDFLDDDSSFISAEAGGELLVAPGVEEEEASQRDHDATSTATVDLTEALAQGISRLSVQEREEMMFAIHGVSGKIEETPELVESSLEQLEKCLVAANSETFNQARAENREYTDSVKFRLRFLRADKFDPEKAARRLISYLEYKCGLFGVHTLARDITLADFDPETRDCLDSGHHITTQLRDTAGRLVFVYNMANLKSYYTDTQKARCWLYQFQVAAFDEDVAKYGVVSVIINNREPENGDPESVVASNKRLGELLAAFPNRYVSMHICNENQADDHALVVDLLNVSGEGHFNTRVRCHEGTFEQCKINLMTYGIPAEHIPIKADGTSDLEQHREWLAWRNEVETRCSDSVGVMTDRKDVRVVYSIKQYDVLLGKTKIVKNHVGNFRYQEIIHERFEEYDQSIHKTTVATEIVEHIKSTGGRFLRAIEHGTWEEVEDEVSIERVCNAFRDRRKLYRKKQLLKNNQTQSITSSSSVTASESSA